MAWILLKPSNYKQVAPLVRTGGSRHTGLPALPHRNIQKDTFPLSLNQRNIWNLEQAYPGMYITLK